MNQRFFLVIIAILGLTSPVSADLQEVKNKTGSVARKVAMSAHSRLKRTKSTISTSAQKIKNYFSDPALGGVCYYESMATDARPIPEKIQGFFAINAFYYKFYPRTLRQWLQRQGTRVEFNNWWRKVSKWFQEETGEYDGADIKKFVTANAIDMTDCEPENPSDYEDFNHFFFRKLKSGVRKIDMRLEVVASPADCKVRVLPNITSQSKFFVKQKPFDLKTFVHDDELSAQYEGGTLIMFRLAPTDYHRFHFPFACTPSLPVLIKGDYETVSPIAFRVGLWPISNNKRARILLSSVEFGDVIMMVVGACMVASLNFTYEPGVPVEKGQEAGYFAFGGSTVCLLFKKDAIVLPEVLISRSEHKGPSDLEKSLAYEKGTAFETAVRMGQGIAMQEGAEEVDLLSDLRYVDFMHKKNKEVELDLDDFVVPASWNVTVKTKRLLGF